ncbi:MAG: hypothetical protein ACTSWY_15865 [Promethearchaeota archaeon]
MTLKTKEGNNPGKKGEKELIKSDDIEFEAVWENLSSRRRCESTHRKYKMARFKKINKPKN